MVKEETGVVINSIKCVDGDYNGWKKGSKEGPKKVL